MVSRGSRSVHFNSILISILDEVGSYNMESSDKMEVAKDTIRRWLASKGYPSEFLRFFFKWTLLNLFYNELSNEPREVNRVLVFGRKNEELLDDWILKHTARLVQHECVGDGIGEAPPSSWVKTASMRLREYLNLDKEAICTKCRRGKRTKCQGIQLENYRFGPFEALMRIVYQIRCNLFHGNKSEYQNNQGRRNRDLVIASNAILEAVLEKISQ